MTDADNSGPPDAPADAYVARRREPSRVMIGGRDVAPAGSPDGILQIDLDGRRVRELQDLGRGAVVRRVDRSAAGRAGGGGRRTRISRSASWPLLPGTRRPPWGSSSSTQPSRAIPSSPTSPTGMSSRRIPRPDDSGDGRPDRARSTVRGADRDLELTLTGESPLRNFPHAPTVIVRAGDVELARFSPTADFTQRLTIPLATLAAAGGHVTVSTDLTFSPADRGVGADRRQLGLRLYRVDCPGALTPAEQQAD